MAKFQHKLIDWLIYDVIQNFLYCSRASDKGVWLNQGQTMDQDSRTAAQVTDL